MRSRVPTTIPATALLLALPAAAQEQGSETPQTGQTVDRRTLTDHDYRFRLTIPSIQWRLLGQQEASAMNPDAAAMMTRGPAMLMVLVEPLGDGVDPEDYLAMLAEAAGPTARDSVVVDSPEIDGRVATACALTIDLGGGSSLRTVQHVLIRDGFGYQFTCVGFQEPLSYDEVTEMLAAIEWLDGGPRLRTTPFEIRDARGADFEVENGLHRILTPGGGVAVEIDPTRFRTMHGPELEQTDPQAAVGFCSVGDVLYGTLTCVPCAEEEAPKLLDELVPTTKEVEVARRVEVLGATRAIETWSADASGLALDAARAHWHEHGALHVLYFWWRSGAPLDVDTTLDAMLASLRRLDAEEQRALERRLVREVVEDSKTDGATALAGGVFVDFDSGLSWTMPRGSAWQVAVGMEMGWTGHSGYSTVARHRPSGLELLLEAQEWSGDSDQGAHDAALTRLSSDFEELEPLGSESLDLDPATTDEAPLLLSRFTSRLGAVQQQTWLGTIRTDGKLLIATASAPGAADQPTRDLLRAAFLGLRHQPGLRAVDQSTTGLVDRRFGIRLRHPADRTCKEFPVPELGELGSQYQILHADRLELQVAAVHSFDTADPLELMKANLALTLITKMGYSSSGWEPATLADRPSERTILRRLFLRRGEMHVFQRGSLVYMVMLFGSEERCAEIAQWLSLLEDPLQGIERSR